MHYKKAFTLIELLVVIAIIGILSGFIVVSMSGATNAAKDAKRKADIDALRKALLYYKTQTGSYPTATCSVNSSCTALSNALIPNYIGSLPADPTGTYYTYTSSDGTDFTVSAILSNSTNYRYVASTGFSNSSLYSSTCVSGGGVTCTETTVGADAVYSFTGAGSTTWTVPTGVTQARVLVVGGGGSGAVGYYGYGGGGAGGVVYHPMKAVSGSISITVGAGGSVRSGENNGFSGSNSSFSDITAYGGGAGVYTSTAIDGGSTGGCGWSSCAGVVLQGNSGGGTGYGNAGGIGIAPYNSPGGSGGGGGGAGGPGGQSPNNGGVGMAFDITGSSVYYAGGGGGKGGILGAGGNGGGGAGSNSNNGVSGTPNTGGGGGAGHIGYSSGAGGSGIVIVRFTKP